MARRQVATTLLALVAAVAVVAPLVADRWTGVRQLVLETVSRGGLPRDPTLVPPRVAATLEGVEGVIAQFQMKTSVTLSARPGVRISAKPCLGALLLAEIARSAASLENAVKREMVAVDVTLPRQAPVQSAPRVAPGRNAVVIHLHNRQALAAGTTVSAASASFAMPPATTCGANASQAKAVKHALELQWPGPVKGAPVGLLMVWCSVRVIASPAPAAPVIKPTSCAAH